MRFKRIIRGISVVLGFIGLTLAIGLFLLSFLVKTSYFQKKVITLLTEQLSQKWNITLSTGKLQLEGPPFTHLILNEVTLQGQQKEKFAFKKLEMKVSLLSLLRKKISFPFIRLTGFKSTIIKTKEGLFTVSPFPVFTFPVSDTPRKGRANSFSIYLKKVLLQEGTIEFIDFTKKTPQKKIVTIIEGDISLDSIFDGESRTFQADIQKFLFSLNLFEPTITAKGKMTYSDEDMTISNFELFTKKSHLQIEGNILLKGPPSVKLRSQLKNFSLKEGALFFKKLSFPSYLYEIKNIAGRAEIGGTFPIFSYDLFLSLEREQKMSKIKTEGRLDLSNLNFPHFSLNTSIKGLPLQWLLSPKIAKKQKSIIPSSIDLEAQIEGKGKNLTELSLDFNLETSSFTFYGQAFSSLILAGRFKNKRISLEKTTLFSPMVSVEINGTFDLRPSFPYQFTLFFHSLDLHNYSKDLPSSRFSGKIELNGKLRKSPKKDFYTAYSLQLFPSAFDKFYLHDLLFEGNLEKNRVQFHFKTDMEGLTLSAQGILSKKKIKIGWDLKEIDFSLLQVHPLLKGTVTGQGQIYGDFAQPAFKGLLNGQNVTFKVYSVDDFSLDISAQKKDLKTHWSIQSTFADDKTIQAKGSFFIPTWQHIEVQISELIFPLENIIWKNKEPIQLLVTSHTLKIESLLTSEKGGNFFLIGEMDREGSIVAKVGLSELPLGILKNSKITKTFPLSGLLGGEMYLFGTRASPNINGMITVTSGNTALFPFDSILATFSYKDKMLNPSIVLVQKEKEALQLKGQIPIDLSFLPIDGRLSTPGLDLQIRLQELDLAFLTSLPFISHIQGLINGQAKIRGSLLQPEIEGHVEFIDTLFQIKPLLQRFSIKEARIKGDNRYLTIEEMNILGSSGAGKLSAKIEMKNLSLQNIQANLSMDQWEIAYSEDTTFSFTGQITSKGPPDNLLLAGDIIIPRGKISIAEFLFAQKYYPEIKVIEAETEESLVKKKPSFFKENIGLDLTLTIPRNLWIKAEKADFELKGKLFLEKIPSEARVITGEIQSVRGYYEFYGKKFTIQKAVMLFQGTKEINPLLDIKTLYQVGEINIFILITGSKNAPVIALQSEPPLSQNDIISYLVFGRAVEDLNQRESAGLQAEAFALLGRVVATEVLGIFGEKLPVDTIQIRASDQGTQSLELGKYITSDIFVTIGKEFGFDGTEQLRVEYYLYSNLILETEIRSDERSGIDLIWKKDF